MKKTKLLLLGLCMNACLGYGQSLSPFAGNGGHIASGGVGGYTGDGGAATSAGMWNPIGVARDQSGNVYIADCANHSIRKVDGSGIITTIIGSASGTAGFAGDGDPLSAGTTLLNTPYKIRFDAAGNLYIADLGNNCIRKVSAVGGAITPASVINTVAGMGTVVGYSGDSGPATSATLRRPIDMIVDNAGNLFIADMGN